MWSNLSVRALSIRSASYTRFHNLLECLMTFLLMRCFSAEQSWNDRAVNGRLFSSALLLITSLKFGALVSLQSSLQSQEVVQLDCCTNITFLRPECALNCRVLSLQGLWITWMFGIGPKPFCLLHPGITNNNLKCFHTADMRLSQAAQPHISCFYIATMLQMRMSFWTSRTTCSCRAWWCPFQKIPRKPVDVEWGESLKPPRQI